MPSSARFIRRWEASLAAGLAAMLAIALPPAEVEACGGNFCDATAGSMSVPQTGETILFAIDSGYVEAHVQISYDGGDATQFAWIVPVPEIPEIEVGSWRLVQAVLAATVPVYGFEDAVECDDGPSPPSTTGAGFIMAPDGGGGLGPGIVAQDVVGAFEYVVLQGGTSDGMTQWLSDNGYTVEVGAAEIFDEYIAEGHVFVAFKLRHGALVEDIHPVVIRYPGTEPCIPIRLTRVAAEEDMEIRALVLGEARVVPTTYRHVQLNRTRLNWLGYGSNYAALVSQAVDEPGADGRAFVTEYAGPSSVVDIGLLDHSLYDAGAFAELPVVEVVDELVQQGLMTCGAVSCSYTHELVPSLLHEFLPVPEGLDEGEFYSCLSCFVGLIDPVAWDPAAFMAAYHERIVAPLLHAEDLLQTWPYLTRLYTRISPHEMTADPMFTENPELDDVANRHGASREQHCCGRAVRLPGGREVWLAGSGWPTWEADMPYAERIEEFTTAPGAPLELVNHSVLIDQLLDAWNQDRMCDGEGSEGSVDDSGGPSPPESSTGTGGAAQEDEAKGCGCRSGGSGVPNALAIALGLGLGLRRRRRRG